MPKDPSIRRVLIIGSGPIVIGQACEFDYSGTQAVRALRDEGVGVVLLNSNPATIMTDPELAERTYVEPITVEVVDEILRLERERGTPVDVLLPTLGGQTGLNTAMAAADGGLLERHGIRMIGADRETIRRAEDRELFKLTALGVGVDCARSEVVHSYEEALDVLTRIPLPVVLRPAFTLGGSGGGRARTMAEFETIIRDGLAASPVRQVLVEEDLTGWKEFELEMMRDRRDNVVVVCSIENFDPMGVHTGDSITVAPAMTLSDKEYQRMRDAAIAIMRAVGVETGGANIQFAVNPLDGRMIVIEMNPRVSRSSALASKATGFPIAKIATKLALGYTLDELRNDITRQTPACFEPAIDYCVVKMPRFTFEKFPDADETLTTAMKSVGEAMAIGRTFKEALQKCIRSMEIKRPGYGLHPNDRWLESLQPAEPVAAAVADEEQWLDPFGKQMPGAGSALVGGSTMAEPPGDWQEGSSSEWPIAEEVLTNKIGTPCQGRLYYIRYALKRGWSIERIHELSGIDPWFLDQLAELVDFEQTLLHTRVPSSGAADARSGGQVRITPEVADVFQQAKALGYSDAQLRSIWRIDAAAMARLKAQLDRPKFKLVDTCAGEFEAYTPYYYSTHERPLARIFRDPAAVRLLRQRPGQGPASPVAGVAPAARGSTPAAQGNGDQSGSNRAGGEPGDVLRRLGVQSPYRYRVLDDEHVLVESHDDELRSPDRPVVVILGGGPNRIGQGIEFDYCCVHAAMAAREMGYEAVMINSNPETVSTDYDISDKLFFEPLTHEHVLNICERLNGQPFAPEGAQRRREGGVVPEGGKALDKRAVPRAGPVSPPSRRPTTDREGQPEGERLPVLGVIVQFGGQTPLNLAKGLQDAGVPILGTSPESIHLSEDRERFSQIIRELGLRQPPSEIAYSRLEAARLADQIGYPILVRPSYVLGGRGMQVCNNANDLLRYIDEALAATDREAVNEQHPILIDKFLLDAIEVDVDAISDYGQSSELRVRSNELPARPGEPTLTGPSSLVTLNSTHDPAPEGRCDICGIMEHIEEAGIHSGDSCCVLPPYSLSPSLVDEIKHQVKLLARRLSVCGLMNVQFAIQGRTVYVIEVNPRASRTIPFVSKATGIPWAKLATKVMLGMSLDEAMINIPIARQQLPRHTSVKAPVFPFKKFRGVDFVLGPEMRSTGEVMGIDDSYPLAFAKAMLAAGVRLPTRGRVLVSVNDPDKPRVVSIARELHELGFEIFSTIKTHLILAEHGVPSRVVSKHAGQEHPFLLELIRRRELDLLINTPIHTGSASEEGRWRAASVELGIPLITTLAGARAAVGAIRAMRNGGKLMAKALQDYLA